MQLGAEQVNARIGEAEDIAAAEAASTTTLASCTWRCFFST
jgi:hypothetical protein